MCIFNLIIKPGDVYILEEQIFYLLNNFNGMTFNLISIMKSRMSEITTTNNFT